MEEFSKGVFVFEGLWEAAVGQAFMCEREAEIQKAFDRYTDYCWREPWLAMLRTMLRTVWCLDYSS